MTSPPPTLLSYIERSLSQHLPTSTEQSYTLTTLRSQPRRSYALFPHSTLHRQVKLYQEELLCILSKPSTLSSTTPVPIVAIESTIYTIPSTSTSILYISKVDTTGLHDPLDTPSPSPTKFFISSFLSYHVRYRPHETRRLRIHLFAKSQGQYLFPGSVENVETKRVLDDKGLIRWWKRCFEKAFELNEEEDRREEQDLGKDKVEVKPFYFVPGLTYLESLPYVPNTNNPTSSNRIPNWTYGHSYSTLPSPLHPIPSSSSSSSSSNPTLIDSTSKSTYLIPDLIPAFPDDPKSRFLHSLTSSSLSPSGSPGDYDDLHLSLTTMTLTSGVNALSGENQKRLEMERERERERGRLVEGVEGGVEEWWIRMEFRQECSSGQLVGFFVIGVEPIVVEEEEDVSTMGTKTTTTTKMDSRKLDYTPPKPFKGSLPHASFTKLWTQFHNQDYSLESLRKHRKPTTTTSTGEKVDENTTTKIDEKMKVMGSNHGERSDTNLLLSKEVGGEATGGGEGERSKEEISVVEATGKKTVRQQEGGGERERERGGGLIKGLSKWYEDVHKLVKIEGFSSSSSTTIDQEREGGGGSMNGKEEELSSLFEKHVESKFKVHNPHLLIIKPTTTGTTSSISTTSTTGTVGGGGGAKREATTMKVNTLAPRKKVKK